MFLLRLKVWVTVKLNQFLQRGGKTDLNWKL